MATSVQQVSELNDIEKETIGEAMKEAKNFLANNNNATVTQDLSVFVAGVIKNTQSRRIKLQRTYDSKGNFVVNPPEKIDGGGGSGAFLHQGAVWTPELPVFIEGAVGGVIYNPSDNDPPSLGWLLAWDKTGINPNGINKVYVEAGSMNRIMNIDWSEIQQKLNSSGSTSRYLDRETGAIAAAQIEDHGDNASLLGASFDFIFIDPIRPPP